MPWFGDGNTHRVSYDSSSPNTIATQIQLMLSVGIEGIIVTWQGPSTRFSHQVTLQLATEVRALGMVFGILLDPHVAAGGGTKEANVSAALADPGFLAMWNNPAYLAEKYILDYSTGADFTKVTLPPGAIVLANQKGFGWPNAYNGDNTRTLAELKSTNTAGMKIPAITAGFIDAGQPTPLGVKPSAFTGTRNYGVNVWGSGPPRAIDHQAGALWLSTIDVLPPGCPYAGLVTWNDHDEGTGFEQWIAVLNGERI